LEIDEDHLILNVLMDLLHLLLMMEDFVMVVVVEEEEQLVEDHQLLLIHLLQKSKFLLE
jgi:hypothetical protein